MRTFTVPPHSMDRAIQHEVTTTLGSLPRLLDAWGPGDDWTGITNTAERKKRQNRLNQRAYRRKRNMQKPKHTAHMDTPAHLMHLAEYSNASALSGCNPMLVLQQSEATLHDGPVLLTCPRRIARIRELLRYAYTEYSLHAFRPTNLPMLIRLNVLNALARNAIAMGFPPEGLCSDDMISPYNEEGPTPLDFPRLSHACPDTLTPTQLQRKVRHHPWIDLFPFPKLRDNMLAAMNAGIFNEDDLCMDLLNVEAEDLGTRPALIVWGESWDTWGWEVNIPFLRKWGWLIQGCPEIIEGSNQWREKRGERRLVFDPT